MRKKFIVGNWKMHTDAAEAGRLARSVVESVGSEERVSVAICPPFPYLALVAKIVRGSQVALGAQNLFPEPEGAFTGEVSPTMLVDLGCKTVVLGHSERRTMLNESDEFINRKVLAAAAAGLDVILCIGETAQQRGAKQTEAVLTRQLDLNLIGLSTSRVERLTIAYEPLWAIGAAGHHATPEQAENEHSMIRRHFRELFGNQAAETLIIQYGGSVKPDNAAALLNCADVDGALIGGASLDASEFVAIIRASSNEPQFFDKAA